MIDLHVEKVQACNTNNFFITNNCIADSCDFSDRTFVFTKNIYKSKNRYNYQIL